MWCSSREKGITVEYQDVIPSTDLPPYVKGKTHCYLHVVVGKLAWRGDDVNNYKLPLSNTTYIRLRWWGDTSQGTYFRPAIEKYSRIIKCRCQFCVRSAPEQIAAYFKDMGAATFDILQSPNSIPIARVLVPAVVSLSFNCSIRGSFPVRTPSAKTIGDLQVTMSFKPRRCDCEETNLDIRGINKTVCYRACPPRLVCFVRKNKELREGKRPVKNTFFSPNSKGSSCYSKLSATGRYGMRSCICEDEKACQEKRLANDSNDCYDAATLECCIPALQNKCQMYEPPGKCVFNADTSSEDSSKCCTAFKQNQCPMFKTPRKCIYNPEPPDSCQLQALDNLIEKTKRLNKSLFTVLNRQKEDDRLMKKSACKAKGYARVTIHALQLHKPLEQRISYPDPSCPLASNAPQGMRQMYFVDIAFPLQLLWSGYDSATKRVKSVNTWPGGCVRFDQDSVIEVVLSADTMSQWTSESLKLTILKKDFNCPEVDDNNNRSVHEASIFGTADVPLSCVMEDLQFSFDGCIPVMSLPGTRRFQCSKILGTLQVSVTLSSCNKPFPYCAFAQESQPPQSTFPCSAALNDEVQKSKQIKCKYKEAKKENDRSDLHYSVAKPCVADKAKKRNESHKLFTPTSLFLYLFLDRGENIPAVRLENKDCRSCFTPNVYLVIRSFCDDSDDVSTTNTVWKCHSPSFCCSEFMPIKVDDQFLELLQNKSLIIEVWTKMPDNQQGSDKIVGLVKLPLSFFYDKLKDSDITKISENDCPLVSVDGILPIVDVFSKEERGQLKLVLALGTTDQLNSLRNRLEKSDFDECNRYTPQTSESSTATSECSTKTSECATSSDEGNAMEHTLRVTVHGMQGFMPCTNQLNGNTDCYIEYSFPNQRYNADPKNKDTASNSAILKCFKTKKTPCVRNPQWEHKTSHKYVQPAGNHLHKLFSCLDFGGGKELKFYLWMSRYCPRQSDHLIAKGCIPFKKLCCVLSSPRKKYVKEAFRIPFKFVKPCYKTAGDLLVSIKHIVKPADSLSAYLARSCQDVQIRFALIQASGLRAAVRAATGSDADEGVTTYATIKTSFLPHPQIYITRSVPNSYYPDYNHCIEVPCPIIFCDDDASVSLMEILDTGFIEVQLWQGRSSSDASIKKVKEDDVLLGQVKIPTQLLLFKTKGFKSWCSILSKSGKAKVVGAIQISLSFSSSNAMDLILDGACESSWCPIQGSHLEAIFDLNCGLKLIEKFETDEEYATFRVSIPNLWLPKKWLEKNDKPDESLPSQSDAEKPSKKSFIYLRYKFHDFDTFVSNSWRVGKKRKRKDKEKQENLFNLKLAHQKAFLCELSPSFFWYLKEQIFEIQVWHSENLHRRSKKRHTEPDTLLGSFFIDLSPLLDKRLQTAHHICEMYPLFKAAVDDLDDSFAQVCLHLIPGNDVKAYEIEDLDRDNNFQSHTAESFDSESSEDDDEDDDDDDADYKNKQRKKRGKNNSNDCFSAIVSIEKATCLRSHPSTQDKDKGNFYVSYPVEGDQKEERTNSVPFSPAPVWNDAREILINRNSLEKNGGKIRFQICQDGACGSRSVAPRDQMVGYATVDLSSLTSGFRAVTGWYNVLDRSGKCSGEIKIGVMPTDPLQFTSCSGNTWMPCHKMIHTTPLLCPVIGPMGTFYIPGLSSTADTVTSTFLKEQEKNQRQGRKENTTSNNRENENLYNLQKSALQQNMDELDQIRKNLSQNGQGFCADSTNSVPTASSYQPAKYSTPAEALHSGLYHFQAVSAKPNTSVTGFTQPFSYTPRVAAKSRYSEMHPDSELITSIADSTQPPFSSIRPIPAKSLYSKTHVDADLLTSDTIATQPPFSIVCKPVKSRNSKTYPDADPLVSNTDPTQPQFSIPHKPAKAPYSKTHPDAELFASDPSQPPLSIIHEPAKSRKFKTHLDAEPLTSDPTQPPFFISRELAKSRNSTTHPYSEPLTSVTDLPQSLFSIPHEPVKSRYAQMHPNAEPLISDTDPAQPPFSIPHKPAESPYSKTHADAESFTSGTDTTQSPLSASREPAKSLNSKTHSYAEALTSVTDPTQPPFSISHKPAKSRYSNTHSDAKPLTSVTDLIQSPFSIPHKLAKSLYPGIYQSFEASSKPRASITDSIRPSTSSFSVKPDEFNTPPRLNTELSKSSSFQSPSSIQPATKDTTPISKQIQDGVSASEFVKDSKLTSNQKKATHLPADVSDKAEEVEPTYQRTTVFTPLKQPAKSISLSLPIQPTSPIDSNAPGSQSFQFLDPSANPLGAGMLFNQPEKLTASAFESIKTKHTNQPYKSLPTKSKSRQIDSTSKLTRSLKIGFKATNFRSPATKLSSRAKGPYTRHTISTLAKIKLRFRASQRRIQASKSARFGVKPSSPTSLVSSSSTHNKVEINSTPDNFVQPASLDFSLPVAASPPHFQPKEFPISTPLDKFRSVTSQVIKSSKSTGRGVKSSSPTSVVSMLTDKRIRTAKSPTATLFDNFRSVASQVIKSSKPIGRGIKSSSTSVVSSKSTVNNIRTVESPTATPFDNFRSVASQVIKSSKPIDRDVKSSSPTSLVSSPTDKKIDIKSSTDDYVLPDSPDSSPSPTTSPPHFHSKESPTSSTLDKFRSVASRLIESSKSVGRGVKMSSPTSMALFRESSVDVGIPSELAAASSSFFKPVVSDTTSKFEVKSTQTDFPESSPSPVYSSSHFQQIKPPSSSPLDKFRSVDSRVIKSSKSLGRVIQSPTSVDSFRLTEENTRIVKSPTSTSLDKFRSATSRIIKNSKSVSRGVESPSLTSVASFSSRPTYEKIIAARYVSESASTSAFKLVSAATTTSAPDRYVLPGSSSLDFQTTKTPSPPVQPIVISKTLPEPHSTAQFSETDNIAPHPITSETSSHVTRPLSIIQSDSNLSIDQPQAEDDPNIPNPRSPDTPAPSGGSKREKVLAQQVDPDILRISHSKKKSGRVSVKNNRRPYSARKSRKHSAKRSLSVSFSKTHKAGNHYIDHFHAKLSPAKNRCFSTQLSSSFVPAQCETTPKNVGPNHANDSKLNNNLFQE